MPPAFHLPITMFFDITMGTTYFKFPTDNNRSYDLALNDASFTMSEMKEELQHYIDQHSKTFITTTTTSKSILVNPWFIYGWIISLTCLFIVMMVILFYCRKKTETDQYPNRTRFSLYTDDYFDDVGNGQ